MVCKLYVDKVICFLIAEAEEESRGCFFGLSDVSLRSGPPEHRHKGRDLWVESTPVRE